MAGYRNLFAQSMGSPIGVAQVTVAVWRAGRAYLGEELVMALHKVVLFLDELDHKAVQEAVIRRESWKCLPDSGHDDCNLVGRVIAEICRGWMEMLDVSKGE